jgi:CO/xanthine dehydrogenase Mo-binding subunit
VKIILGDTDVVKVGGGSHSGRSMRHAATVFSKAALDLIDKGKTIAALALDVSPDTVEFTDDGRFISRDTNRSFDFFELAKEAATLTPQQRRALVAGKREASIAAPSPLEGEGIKTSQQTQTGEGASSKNHSSEEAPSPPGTRGPAYKPSPARGEGTDTTAAVSGNDCPLSVVTDNEMHEPVFPNGTAICEVEIDPETGGLALTRYASVDDVGRCINPLIVHGQTHGAIVQGVGQAMWESFHVDPDSGQPFTGSLMDYGMPRADGVPSFTCEISEVLSPTNPLGIKAGGEGGTTPALAAVTNAIVDALSEFGISHIEMPATPDRIFHAMRAGRASRRAA